MAIAVGDHLKGMEIDMKNCKSHDKDIRTRGFTLLELMIVLAVIAVLLAWGMPSLTQSIRNNQVLAQSNELIAMLHFTKGEALRRNKDVPMVLGSDSGGWNAFVNDPEEEVAPDGCEPGQLRCASHTGVTLSVLEDGVDTIVFNNRGYIRDEDDVWTPETIFLKHAECSGNSQHRRIDITATGQVSSCAVACNGTECL